MAEQFIVKGTVYEDGGATNLARIVGNTNVAINQASITGITWSVNELVEGDPVLSADALVVSNVIFNSLQTDAIWTKDDVGYVFKHAVPPTAFPEGGKKYRVEYLFDPVDGEDFWVVFEVDAIKILRT